MYFCLIYEDHWVRKEFCLIYPENCTNSLCNYISILIENHELRKMQVCHLHTLQKYTSIYFFFSQKITSMEKVHQVLVINLFQRRRVRKSTLISKLKIFSTSMSIILLGIVCYIKGISKRKTKPNTTWW